MYTLICAFLVVCCITVFIVNILSPNKVTQTRDIPYAKLILPLILCILLFFFAKGMLPSIQGKVVYSISLFGIIYYLIAILYKKFCSR